MLGKDIRMNRLIPGDDGKYFGLTVDHAIARGVMPGLDTINDTLCKIIAGGPNAVTMHKGIADLCFKDFAGKVPLSLKLTTFSPYQPGADVQVATVEEALMYGADAVSAGCIVGGDNQAEQIAQLSRISFEARKYGMPLICHIYPRGNLIPAEDRKSVENVIYAARVAAELGADIIKTSYTGSRDSFAKVVDAVPAKVAIAGDTGSKNVREFLQMTRDVIDAGAVGVTYGRYVFTYPNVTELVLTLNKVIHENYSCDEAVEYLETLEHK